MLSKPANVQLVDHRAFQVRHDRRFPSQRLATRRDYSANRTVCTVCTANCALSNPNRVGHSSSKRVHELFLTIHAPGIMCTGGQAFEKNVPEEEAPVCVRIEGDNLNRLRAVCRVIKQQLDSLRIS